MSEELALYEDRTLTAVDVRAQVNLIQEVMKTVMQTGQHYGIVPGCGNKPTLLKPGAEKIMSTFRLAADPETDDMSCGDIIRYRVKCKLLTVSGRFVGAGIGECSSEEEKYKWRGVVSEAEWNATPEDMKRIKFKVNDQIKQVRTNPFDLANTILKMAKKRALVDAVLTATAASDIFTQDIEDMPEEILNQGKKNGERPPVQQPKPKPTTGESSVIESLIEDVQIASGEKNGKPWTKYGIVANGNTYGTFDKTIGELATEYIGNFAEIHYERNGKYLNATALIPIETADREPGQDG